MKEALRRILPLQFIQEEEPLSKHTSFRIGGPAQWMVFPQSRQDLAAVLQLAREKGVDTRILGAGTNVLAPDEGVRGLVICLRDSLKGLTLLEGNRIEAMAGMTLAQMAMFAARNALSGLEFAHGIPGTVGGGLYMNAGAYGGELKDVTLRTEYLTAEGEFMWLEGEKQGFSYRNSAFQKMDGVIVRAEFQLTPSTEEAVRNRIYELNEKRRASQPLELPSAGSTFKRPAQGYAAALIEQAGLKGLAVGGAQVSVKHAGFVVNTGGATAQDVLDLVALVQEKVYAHSGISLEPEVRLWK